MPGGEQMERGGEAVEDILKFLGLLQEQEVVGEGSLDGGHLALPFNDICECIQQPARLPLELGHLRRRLFEPRRLLAPSSLQARQRLLQPRLVRPQALFVLLLKSRDRAAPQVELLPYQRLRMRQDRLARSF